MNVEIILFVKDQQKSRLFYEKVLQMKPVLDVPGMTEFQLALNIKLGIMPEAGIKKILYEKVPDPASGNGIPRCELYLKTACPTEYLKRAVNAGAVKIDNEKMRDWGDEVAYCADPDGHILAFAKQK